MHLNDALGHHPSLSYICFHHEQAAAMAAECYSRISPVPCALLVTTGPGSINAINGVFGAWTDSIPLFVLSGQVKRETCMDYRGIEGLRQLGDQEVNIVEMVKGVVKSAAMVSVPKSIKHYLEEAWFVMNEGRKGPVWLDVPVDVQGADSGYDAVTPPKRVEKIRVGGLETDCDLVLERIKQAKRPVILAGTGIRLADAVETFSRVVHKLGIPVTTAWTHDIIASDDELFCGRPGTIGTRAGNFTVQNADLVLILGSRLNIRQVSYNWPSFAKNAHKIQVDIDREEMRKPTVNVDYSIRADVGEFLEVLESRIGIEAWERTEYHTRWLGKCRGWMEKYPVVTDAQRNSPKLNPYHLIEVLFDCLRPDDIIVCGNAAACIIPFQVAKLKMGQRLISNSGSASMGYDLPAAIGAAVAAGGKRVICIAGDGSLQFNIQELQTLVQLQTLVHYQSPVKIIVLENGGYLSIRQTQNNFFGRETGAGPESGVTLPDYARVSRAYCIPCTTEGLDYLPIMLNAPGLEMLVVSVDPAQEVEPRLKSRQLADGTIVSPELEDMYPFLPAEELAENMRNDD